MQRSIGQQAIKLFLDLMTQYPTVRVVVSKRMLTIKGSQRGFDVIIADEHGEATVYGWQGLHVHFSDPTSAAYTAIYMLSPCVRACHIAYNGRHGGYILQFRGTREDWTSDPCEDFPMPGRKRVTEIRMNRILSRKQIALLPPDR